MGFNRDERAERAWPCPGYGTPHHIVAFVVKAAQQLLHYSNSRMYGLIQADLIEARGMNEKLILCCEITRFLGGPDRQ